MGRLTRADVARLFDVPEEALAALERLERHARGQVRLERAMLLRTLRRLTRLSNMKVTRKA